MPRLVRNAPTVARFRCASKPGILVDGNGLMLRIQKSGAKSNHLLGVRGASIVRGLRDRCAEQCFWGRKPRPRGIVSEFSLSGASR